MAWVHDLVAALRLIRSAADRPLEWQAAGIALLVILGGVIVGVGPVALQQLIDGVSATPDRQVFSAQVIGGAWWYLAALTTGRILATLRNALMGTAEQHVYARLKQRFLHHLLYLPLSFHVGRQSGSVTQSLEQGLTGCQILIFTLFNSVLPVAVELVTIAAVLTALDQPMLVASLVATAIAYLAVVGWSSRRIRGAAHTISQDHLRAQGLLADSLINWEPIKCFNAENTACARHTQVVRQLEGRWRHWHLAQARQGLLLTAVFALTLACSLAMALQSVAEGTLSIGGLVLTNVYLLQLVRPLEMLATAARDLSQSLGFIRPLRQLLDEPLETVPPPTPRTEVPSRPMTLSFREVWLSFDEEEPVLRGFNLELQAGQHLAIVGASGSGKTSLVRLLLRLHTPLAGTILVDGQPLHSLPAHQVRRMIGLVPQDTVLFNDTVAFNISLGLQGAVQQDIEQAAQRAGLHEFISRLPQGYATQVGERGLRLSGGERQRIAIARAVLRRPRLFIFDEATSMLDSRTEEVLLNQLQEVCAGCTTLIIAHRLSTICHADQIIVLERGQVAERGDHASLLARSGIYAAMWEAQGRGTLDHGSSP